MLTIPLIVTQIKSEGWYVMIDLKDHLDDPLPYFHPSTTQEISEVRFWGRRSPISGSSIRPTVITLHFHKMYAALPPLRLKGIIILNYMDYLLISAQSQEMVARL